MTMRRSAVRGRGSGGRSQVRAPRRGLFWRQTIINLGIAASASVFTDLLGGVAEDEKKGLTVTRVIYEWTVRPLTVDVSGAVIAFGMGVFNDDAIAAFSLPDPADAGDEFSWYMWSARNEITTSVLNDFAQARTFRGDFRAQRKLPSEEDTFGLISERNASVVTLVVDGWVRSLCKRA